MTRTVGKKIGGDFYIHKSALGTLPQSTIERVLYAYHRASIDFPDQSAASNLIKIGSMKISLIYSSNWDAFREPNIEYSIVVAQDGTTKFLDFSTKDVIYHHKWLFVKDEYEGFDVEESKRWSEYWLNHPKVKKMKANKAEHFSSKIGNYKYWKENVLNKVLNGYAVV
jgi:hypothetical protein